MAASPPEPDDVALAVAAVTAARAALAIAHYNHGCALTAAGQLAAAAAAYREALVLEPTWADALDNLGVVEQAAGDPATAIERFEAALAVDANRPVTRYNLGAAACDRGDYRVAVDQFTRAAALRPGFAAAEFGLAMAWDALGDGGAARAALDRAIAAESTQPRFWAERARLQFVAGELAAALASIERAVTLGPDDAGARSIHSAILLALDRPGDALVAAERAAALAPDRVEVHATCARAAEAADQLDRAVEHYQRALVLDPSHRPGLQNLARLLVDLRRFDELAVVFRQWQAIEPDNVMIAHLAAGLRGEVPTAAPAAGLVAVFDALAEDFEALMVDRLRYCAHRVLVAAVLARAPTRLRRALDLGCGTGLVGRELRAAVDELHGVDLSPAMIAVTRRGGRYDELRVGDVLDDLERGDEPYQLIIAADVVIYLGPLDVLFARVRARLAPGGWWAFSVEDSPDAAIVLAPTGRYAHHHDYLTGLAASHGFIVEDATPCAIRREADVDVPGRIWVLRAA